MDAKELREEAIRRYENGESPKEMVVSRMGLLPNPFSSRAKWTINCLRRRNKFYINIPSKVVFRGGKTQ
jgi:hypothetical protein